MNKSNPPGIGRVVCDEMFLTPNAIFEVEDQPDGAVTIGSTVFPNVFLRIGPDGTVNAQFGAGPYEKFLIRPYGHDRGQDTVKIQSQPQQSPGIFLTFDSPPPSYRGATDEQNFWNIFWMVPIGYVKPRYQLLNVIYAPPGTKGHAGLSLASYEQSSTAGSGVSASSSFKDKTKVSASVSAFGVGVSADFAFSASKAETQSIAVTKTAGYTLTVPGPDVDGIDHNFDLYYLWINPTMPMFFDPGRGVQWGLRNDEVMEIVWVTGGDLTKGVFSPDVQRRFDKIGMTRADYDNILSANPFSTPTPPGSPGAQPDPNRYQPLGQTFPYEASSSGPTKTYTASKTKSQTWSNSSELQYQVSVGVSADAEFEGLFEASLSVSNTMTWTHSNTINNSSENSQSASVTIANPSPGYTRNELVEVYVDTVFNTFMFGFAPELKAKGIA
jgi:hypothetical protein